MTTFTVSGNVAEGISSYQWKMRQIGSALDQPVTTAQFTPARIAMASQPVGTKSTVPFNTFRPNASTPLPGVNWSLI